MRAPKATDIEIMAPVGSFESLHAAIQGGAGSVYFGIGHLNMRSRSSKNFTLDDLREITGICRQYGIRSYITLNTIVYDHETEEMRTIVDAAKKEGVSAVIATDLAVLDYAGKVGMEVHMSTQTGISNTEAVKFYSSFADVMVTARELTLDQVGAIADQVREQGITGPSGNPVRIEVFAHGALCMAISGKCFLSLDNQNSAANRGACLQLCRKPYRVFDADGDTELVIDNEYIMSPKDLKTIDFIDKVLDAGVRVLKIEGRGRSADYVKTVTACYREAVDAVYDGTFGEEKLKKWNEKLATVYNRGFWEGYYLGKKMGEWSERYGSQATLKKIYIGKVTNFYKKIKVAAIKMETHDLSAGDHFMIIGPTTGVYEAVAGEIRVNGSETGRTKKGEVCSIPVTGMARRADKVYKVVPAGEVEDFQNT